MTSCATKGQTGIIGKTKDKNRKASSHFQDIFKLGNDVRKAAENDEETSRILLFPHIINTNVSNQNQEKRFTKTIIEYGAECLNGKE
jgi:hypothetical protein